MSIPLSFDFSIPPIRLPGLGILGRNEPLPQEKTVKADLIDVWAIAYMEGGAVFDVDTFVSMPHYEHRQKVSNFPIEKGGFIAYNKVNEPRKLRVKLAVHGGARVKAFLKDIETELMSVSLYKIITTERTYKNMTLEGATYPRDLKSVDMVTAELTFLEIVQATALTIQGATIASAKKAASNGSVPNVVWAPQPHVPVVRRDLVTLQAEHTAKGGAY